LKIPVKNSGNFPVSWLSDRTLCIIESVGGWFFGFVKT
jgi:hypothetical protein